MRQKGSGGTARHGSRSRAAVPWRGGGKAHGPVSRDHAHDLPKKVSRARAAHALSAKAKDGGIIVWADATVAEAKTKAFARQLHRKIGLNERADHRRCRARGKTWRSQPATCTAWIDVLPIQGINVYDILRRDKLMVDARRGRSAGGAVQMMLQGRQRLPKLGKGAHRGEVMYDVIVAPVITEKATNASEMNQVVFKVLAQGFATQAPRSRLAVERLFDVKVEGGEHAQSARARSKRSGQGRFAVSSPI